MPDDAACAADGPAIVNATATTSPATRIRMAVKYRWFLHRVNRIVTHPPSPWPARTPTRARRRLQRGRLLAALVELLAESGYAGVTIGALAKRASVSRGAFYDHFDDKEACLLAAYEAWSQELIAAMLGGIPAGSDWTGFVEGALDGYLGMLQRDAVAARAFMVEMDAAGGDARLRRREGVHLFAAALAQRHDEYRRATRGLGPLPEEAFLGLALGVRELIRECLEDGRPLDELRPIVLAWATAMVRGASLDK